MKFNTNPIYKLEESITAAWGSLEVLKLLQDKIYASTTIQPADQDMLCNILLGVGEVFNLHMEKLWQDYEHLCAESKTRSNYDNSQLRPPSGGL
jgi:hypothetical protein